jgi:hypothetical protein
MEELYQKSMDMSNKSKLPTAFDVGVCPFVLKKEESNFLTFEKLRNSAIVFSD